MQFILLYWIDQCATSGEREAETMAGHQTKKQEEVWEEFVVLILRCTFIFHISILQMLRLNLQFLGPFNMGVVFLLSSSYSSSPYSTL